MEKRKETVTPTQDKPATVPQSPYPCMPPDEDEDEINLLELWQIVWKRRKMIARLVAAVVVLTVIASLLMTNQYKAQAIIMPVATKESGGSGVGAALMQQFGGLAGIGMPGSASSAEVVGLLKSNILREKMVQKYNLLPVLFYEDWDKEKKDWKRHSGIQLNPLYYVSLLAKAVAPAPPPSVRKKDPGVPDLWDALRLLDDMVNVQNNVKENTITLSVTFHDPDMAAKLVDYFLITLNDYMSSEAKRVADTNRKYLEEQLGTAVDPFIKQKTYNLIAQQIETAMMAGVKENFAFKVIDPPLAPDKKFKPKRAQMAVLSFVVALFLGIFGAFFWEYIEKVRGQSTERPDQGDPPLR